MKKILFLFTLIALVSVILIENAYAETKYQSVKTATTIDLGLLDIRADYTLDFQINSPKEILSGTTEQVQITPTSGVVITSIIFNGENLGSYTSKLDLGKVVTIGIPGGYGVELFVKTDAGASVKTRGPTIISSDFFMNNMTPKIIPVSVSDQIGNYDSVTMTIPITLYTEYGANINLILFNQKLASDTYTLQTNPELLIHIPIKKYYSTTLNLDVQDGKSPGYIKVKPTLIYDNGELNESNVAIYVDADWNSSVQPNQWSSDIHTGSGMHVIRAEFSQTSSKYNKAIIFQDSSDTQKFTVKSPPKPTPSSNYVEKNYLTCGKGTHQENGECISDELFDGSQSILFVIILVGAITTGVIIIRMMILKSRKSSN